jgi:signal transduction histidine kinase
LLVQVIKSIFLYLLIMCSSLSIAQQLSIFQNYSTKDGLPSNYIFDIEEDENGHLWAGTDKGLAKFDGFSWKLITTENGLPGNYIGKIFCNKKDGLWLGVGTKGWYYYDIKSGKASFVTLENLTQFEEITNEGDLIYYKANLDDSFSGCLVKSEALNKPIELFRIKGDCSFYADTKNKKVVVSTNNELNWKNIQIKSTWDIFKNVSLTNYNSHLLRNIDDNFKLSGNAVFENQNAGFSPFVGSKYILKCTPVKDGMWYWNQFDGLCFVNKQGQIKQYGIAEGLTNLLVYDVHITKQNKLLISTLGGGIFTMLPTGNARINTNDKTVINLAVSENQVISCFDNHIFTTNISDNALFKKNLLLEKDIQNMNVIDNKIIVSTLNGFTVYNKNMQKVKSYLNRGGIASVIKNNDEFIAGTYGVHHYHFDKEFNFKMKNANSFSVTEKLFSLTNYYAAVNLEDGLEIYYKNGSKTILNKSNGLISNAVYHVHENKDSLWIATLSGISVFANNKVVKNYTLGDGLKGNRCVYSFHDKYGKLWVVTDKYLNEFNNGKFTALSSAPIVENKNDAVTACVYDSITHKLITGSNKRIYFTNLAQINKASNIDSVQLFSIMVDSKLISTKGAFSLPANYNNLQFYFKPLHLNPFGSSEIYYKLNGLHNDFLLLKDSLQISFSNLRTGDYQLLVKSINADGMESVVQTIATFSIKPKFWQTQLFYGLAGLSIAGIVFGSIAVYQRRKRKKVEAQQLIENKLSEERERISKDLHDHLGTAIVTMIAQTDNVEAKLMNNNIKDALEKVKELSDQSRETVNVLRETIWAVQENNHTVETFILRTKNFLQRILPPKNILWNVQLEGDAQILITANESLQLFRVIQECTQNIVKHSNATTAIYNFNVQNNILELSISDNGIGFNIEEKSIGNGLSNIKQRIERLGGTCTYQNVEPHGIETRIRLIVKTKNNE